MENVRRKRILIVDDDKHFLASLRQMLEHAGYRVTSASNGKEAVKIFQQDPADLVITDLVMPEYDGLETILDIIEPSPEAKIIAVSGGPLGNPDWLPCAKTLGALHTLEKPFSFTALLKKIEELTAEGN